jgi:hypothetical protein
VATTADGSFTASCVVTINALPACQAPAIVLTSATAIPTIDASIDAVWANAPVKSIALPSSGTSTPTGFSAQWRSLYTSTNLYFLVEVTKSGTLYNQNGTSWWNDDAVEIFIDGTNSKTTSYNGSTDFQYGFRYNDGTTVQVGGTNPANSTTGISYTFTKTTTGYNVEVAIPWTTLKTTPVNGNQIGLEVAVDVSSGTTRTTQMATFNNTGMAYSNPSLFGSVSLSQCTNTTPATVTLGSLTATYDGTAKSVTATTSPSGLSVALTYNGSTTVPTAAGTYTVVATVTSAGYQGTASGTLTINKATATVSLNGLTPTYDGTAKTVTATTTPNLLTVNITYNGSTTAPTAVGTYPIVATISNANYQGSATGSLVISKATATVSLNGLTPTYDGTAKTVTATTTPNLLTVNITYNGSTTAPTAVGTYPIVATISNPNYQGSATGSLVISKATATISLSGLTPTYDGTAKTVTATTTPSLLTVNITYNGSTTAPSAVGTYPIVATISDPNYQGSTTGSLVISLKTGTINTETSQVDIISYNNIIKVSGVKIGDVISVYTLNGTLLFNMTATQETEYIYSLKDGVYVVSIVAENIARKVLVH